MCVGVSPEDSVPQGGRFLEVVLAVERVVETGVIYREFFQVVFGEVFLNLLDALRIPCFRYLEAVVAVIIFVRVVGRWQLINIEVHFLE